MRRILSVVILSLTVICGHAQITSYPYNESFDSYANCTPYAYNTACAVGGGWINDVGSTANWLVGSGATNASTSGLTGPGQGTAGNSAIDASTGTTAGNFLFTETSGAGSNETAILRGPQFDLTGMPAARFAFNYHMYGATMGTLTFEVSTNGGGTWTPVFTQVGAVQTNYAAFDPWIEFEADLTPYANMTIDVRFVGATGTSFTSDMAIDEINVYQPVPFDIGVVAVTNPTSLQCGAGLDSITVTIENFGTDTAQGFQVNYILDDPMLGVQPLVTEAYTGQPIPPTGTASFTFAAMGNFTNGGNYTITAYTTFALDNTFLNDTTVANVLNPLVTAPYFEDFETFTISANATGFANGWTTNPANTTTSYRWNPDAGGTPSGGTGPTVDNTTGTGTGIYLFTEASSTGTAMAEIISPCIDISGVSCPSLSFWYHRFGIQMGDLSVDVFYNGVWDNDIFVLTGSQQALQGDPYLQTPEINLAAYPGVIQLRFRAVRGLGFSGDMAIDDVAIQAGSFPNDVSFDNIESPTDSCALSKTEVISFGLTNNSCDTLYNIPVCYTVNGGSLTNDTIPGPVLPSTSSSFAFSQAFDFSIPGPYTIQIVNKDSWDTIPANDTIIYSFNSLFTPDTPTIVQNDTACSPDSLVLVASLTGGSGDTIIWYDGSGAQVGLGDTFVTPLLDTTTTYYAGAAVSSGAPVAGSLTTTFAAGNGCGGGNMFDITTVPTLTITEFDVASRAAQNVDVYYKVGTYVGSQTVPGDWTFVGSYPVPGAGIFNIDIADFVIPGGATYGIYVAYDADYTTGANVYSNADMTITAGQGHCADFDGCCSPRTFNGTVYYTLGSVGCVSTLVPVEAVLISPTTTTLGPDSTFCFGDTIVLDPGMPAPNTTYMWSTGDTTQSISTGDGGVYWVDMDVVYCTLSDTIVLTRRPEITLNMDSMMMPLCHGDANGSIYITADRDSILDPGSVACGPNLAGCPAPPVDFDLGTGTNNSGTTGGPTPYDNFWEDGRIQMLYQASELQAAGMSSGTISSIGFNVALVGSTQPYSGFTIKMGCSNAADLSGGLEPISDVVYGPLAHNVVAGWNIHNLATPYGWDGTSNVVVEICFDNASWGDDDDVFFTTTPFTSVHWGDQDGVSGCTMLTDNFSSDRPNTRFGFCNAVDVNTPPSFTYVWSNGDTTEDLGGATAGTYDVTVTDDRGCPAELTGMMLNQPDSLDIALDTLINTSCGVTIGELAVTVSGGTAPYSYNWNNGDTTDDINGLAAGNYFLIVTDANGCMDTSATWTIADSGSTLTITIDSTFNIDCNGDSTGAIYVTAANGAAPYSYAWDNGATTEDLIGVPAGSYTLTVTDTAGCTDVTSIITLTESPALVLTIDTVIDAGCNGDSSGAIQITVMGGTGAYTYAWSNGMSGEDIMNIPAGNYAVTVTDSLGCVVVDSSMMVGEPASMVITLDSVTHVVCSGDFTGAAYISVTGGAGSYSYMWSNSLVFQDITNIPAGTYSVVVTDGNGCVDSLTGIMVNEPATFMVQTDSITHVLCNGDSTGAIYTTTMGGTPGYSYMWNTGDTTSWIADIPAGTYSLTITDTNGCMISTGNIDVTEPGALGVILDSLDNVLCNGDSTGAIYITPFGGPGGGSFVSDTMFPGPFVNNFTANLTRGYWFTAPSNFNITGLRVPTDVGTNPQTIQVVRFTGIPIAFPGPGTPFTTLFYVANVPGNNAIPTNIPVSAGDIIGILGARGTTGNMSNSYGNAGVVTNLDGNLVTLNRLVYQNNLQNVQATGTTVMSENAAQIARIEMEYQVGAPGNATYSYLWSNGDTTQDITMLPMGSYTVTIIDSNGCSFDTTFTVSEPPALALNEDTVVHILCNGDSTGAINITMSGGVPPYSFNWSTGDSTEDLSGLPAGIYMLTVTDSNGCTLDTSYTLTEPAPLTIMVDSVIDVEGCFGDTTGGVYVTVTGGVMPYSYQWNNGDTTSDLTNVGVGAYFVVVTDANGCTVATVHDTISQPEEMEITVDSVTHISCFGDPTGAIYISVTGGTGSYDYQWTGGAMTQDITGIGGGQYTVTVTDSMGCELISPTITVVQPSNPMSITIDSIISASCQQGTADGAIYISTSGGSQPYIYSWSDGQITEDALALVPGTYTVTIIDAQNCQFISAGLTVGGIGAAPTVDLGMDTIACDMFTLDAGPQPAGVSYLWSTGSVNQTIDVTTTGSYWVEVTNSCGNDIDAVFVDIITAPVAAFGYFGLDLTASFTNLSVVDPTTSFHWDFDDGNTNTTASPTHTYTSGGAYSVTLTVTNACGTDTYTDDVIIIPLSIIDAFGDENFTIYPNPTEEVLNVELVGDYPGELMIEMHNVLGEVVMSEGIDYVSGTHKTVFDVRELAKGTYYVTITDGERYVTKQVVIQ